MRLHAVLPPVAAAGTCLSLRVLRPASQDLAALTAAGAIDPVAAALVTDIIAARLAFLVSGGTGAGKTTLLAAMLGAVPPAERIVCVEDAAELAPRHPHLVKLVARCANVEGVGEVPVRQLVRQALRMRPDRIVVGEVRGAEVVDLLAALNTGTTAARAPCTPTAPARFPPAWRRWARSAASIVRRCTASSPRPCRCCCMSNAIAPAGGDSARSLCCNRFRSGSGRSRCGTRIGDDGRRAPAAARPAKPDAGVNGPQAGALLLTLALVIGRPSPRRRLRATASPRWRLPSHGIRGVVWVAVGLGCAAVALLPLTTVLCGAVVGATVSVRYLRRRRIRRATREGHALETALDVLVGELRAGAHPVRAFGVAADETAGAVAASLRSVAARARLGADVAAGLAAASRSSALPAQWERLALCWRLASDNGLGIATLMRAAQRDIAERQRFSARVASSLAGRARPRRYWPPCRRWACYWANWSGPAR